MNVLTLQPTVELSNWAYLGLRSPVPWKSCEGNLSPDHKTVEPMNQSFMIIDVLSSHNSLQH